MTSLSGGVYTTLGQWTTGVARWGVKEAATSSSYSTGANNSWDLRYKPPDNIPKIDWDHVYSAAPFFCIFYCFPNCNLAIQAEHDGYSYILIYRNISYSLVYTYHCGYDKSGEHVTFKGAFSEGDMPASSFSFSYRSGESQYIPKSKRSNILGTGRIA